MCLQKCSLLQGWSAMHSHAPSMLQRHSHKVQAVLVQELKFIEQTGPVHYKIKQDFVPNMHVPGYFYLNDRLKGLVFEELQIAAERGGIGGFLPAVKQIANVAGLPGIVKVKATAHAVQLKGLRVPEVAGRSRLALTLCSRSRAACSP